MSQESENLQWRIRQSLGEFNDDTTPVVLLCHNLSGRLKAALAQEAEPSAEGRAQKAERARDAMTNELGRLAVENAQLRALRFARFNNEECWIYQGDGEDHLESLVCPVVIAASTLLGIIVGPPKPAPLPQPVASVPQDVEEFIAEKQRHNASLNHNAIHTDDLRAWMAGHARVPDWYIAAAEKAILTACNNAVEKLNELAPQMGWDSGEVVAEMHIRPLRKLLAASQQEGV